MEQGKRACFALIAATLVNKRRYNSVFDYHLSRCVFISTTGINNSYKSFFDYGRGGYVSGNEKSMYDYPSSSYVSIAIRNNVVDCFDYESGNYVSFTVRNRNISAFDYQTSRYYEYGAS